MTRRVNWEEPATVISRTGGEDKKLVCNALSTLWRRAGFLIAWLAALLIVCLAEWPAMAQETAPSPPEPGATLYSPVRLAGRTLFEVPGTEAETAAARANRISRRLETLAARDEPVRPFGPEDIRRREGQPLITLGDEAIMVVTAVDAEDSLASPGELALLWGQKMAAAVADARELRQNPLRGAGILIRNSVRDLFVSTVQWLPRLGVALVLAVLFWGLARVMVWLVCTIGERTGLDPNLRQLARALSFYVTWGVGVVAILTALGFQTGGIIATLGITGFVLGFAFKDILSHFLAGMMLLLGRQFRIGDQIVVKEHEGTVERIELRAMHLRTYDNRLVIIPNAEVFTSVITSNTWSPYRRREFVIGIGYEQEIERAMEVCLNTVRATPGVLADPTPDVLVDELAASSVNLRARFYVNSLRADYLQVGSECMRRVKEAFDREAISMPTEIRTVIWRPAPEAMEALGSLVSPGAPTPPAGRQPETTERRRAA